MRALDVNLTETQKAQVRAMTRRPAALCGGGRRQAHPGADGPGSVACMRTQMPRIGNELAYIARYTPEVAEADEHEVTR